MFNKYRRRPQLCTSFIAGAINEIREAGWFWFVFDAKRFFRNGSKRRNQKWFKEEGYLQGMIQLPDELFRNKQSQKSILILQKKGPQAKQVKEVLLVKLASLKEPEKVTEFFNEFKNWKSSAL
ncbi:N-6 DNA methylase [Enterococcus faecium]|nr:N-6 DNA methylase [Enterococcus faecium]NVE09031.1 N-6 DNA methylase [Enterococcus faecium]NVF25130.1 N-6 DNA methylase [Enterococcus faecium]